MQISFEFVPALGLVIVVPASLVVYAIIARRHRTGTARFSSLHILGPQNPNRVGIKYGLLLGLYSLLSLLLSIAAARPMGEFVVFRQESIIIFTVDVSYSMCADDIYPNRLAAAQEAMLRILDRLERGMRIGVVSFSGRADIVQNPTTNYAKVKQSIRSLTVGQRTAIGNAILRSLEAIAQSDPNVKPLPEVITQDSIDEPTSSPHMIVLLTDGVSNFGVPIELAAQLARERGVRVYAIGYGTDQPIEELNCPSDLTGGKPIVINLNAAPSGRSGEFLTADESGLRMIAEATGGKYFTASDQRSLLEALGEIPAEFVVETDRAELAPAFALAGLIVAAIAVVLTRLWRPLV